MSSKFELAQRSNEAVQKFLMQGGSIKIVKSKKAPKVLTAGAGSVKHCGRTNAFGQRI
jgi:hypothetical protein